MASIPSKADCPASNRQVLPRQRDWAPQTTPPLVSFSLGRVASEMYSYTFVSVKWKRQERLGPTTTHWLPLLKPLLIFAKQAAITHRRTYTRNYHRGPASAAKRKKKVETCPLDGIHLTRVDATEDRPSVRAERKEEVFVRAN